MLHERIKYKDLDGNEVEDDFYFHLSSAELAEMEVEVKGGMKEYFERIVKADDRGEIVKAFKKILLASVGRRSENGKMFLKTPEIVNEFQYSGAYEVMFFRLLGDAAKAAEFVNTVFPSDLVEKVRGMGGMPVAVDLPTTPGTPQLPNLNVPGVSPEQVASIMQAPEFQELMRRHQERSNNPLGL